MSELDLQQLLLRRQWLRRLAVAIVGEAWADDVVQETWTAALTSPPLHGDQPKAWLARVARRFAWKRASGERQRTQREESVLAPLAKTTAQQAE